MTMPSVLVVEDERIVAMDIRMLLQQSGYQVPAIATTGLAALEAVERYHPDLVLMDIQLQGDMTGVDVAEHLHALYDIPVIFLTAFADKTTRERVRRIAPYGYLVKPFNEVTLQTTIEMALERHAQDRRLRESQQWFATTLASIGDAVITTDAQGDVTFANVAAERLLHRSQEEMIGQPVVEIAPLIDAEQRTSIPHPVKQALEQGKVVYLVNDTRLLLPDGSDLLIDDSVAPITVDAAPPLGAVMVFRDSSRRQEVFESRISKEQQAEKERQHERLRTLAGGIAHDLNNLLTTMIGNTEMVRTSLLGNDPAHELLTPVLIAAQQAADLARQLLAYAGRARQQRHLIDCNTLIEELVYLLRSTTLNRYHVRLALEKPLPQIHVDATQIRQVVQNLLLNAAEAIGDQAGEIKVATSVRHYDAPWQPAPHLAQLPAGTYTLLEVMDTGSGMDAATLSHIFEPFFSTKAAGRGLGLAAVEGIIREHQGAITVHSTPGAGTTFSIWLPGHAALNAPTPKIPSTGAHWHGVGTVLVIDDETSVRVVTSRLLTHLGFEVLTAADGVAGLDLFLHNDERINCVLLDMTMPGMSGREVAQSIRQHNTTVPIVLMSGHSREDMGQILQEDSKIQFLSKPFLLADLRSLLREIFAPIERQHPQ